MSFFGKTLDFFRRWADQSFIKVKTNNPSEYNKISYKLETVYQPYGTNIGGSAELEMKPGYMRLGVKAKDTIITGGGVSEIILEGETITISLLKSGGLSTTIVIDATSLANLGTLIGAGGTYPL